MRSTLTLGKLVVRIYWPVAICVLFAVGGLVRLGLWQLDRAQQKIDEQLSFQEAGQLQSTPLDEVPVAGLEFDALQHQNRRVALRGQYMNDRNIFLIYQTWEDQIGWEVLTPFRLESGNLIALVSRGWHAGASAEEVAAALPALSGTLDLQGQLHVPTPKQAARGNGDVRHDSWPLVLRYPNMDELTPLFAAPLFPYVVRLAEGQPGELVRFWPVVSVDSGRNFSYALQWFAMAIALSLVSLILSSNLLQAWQRQRPR